MERSIAIRTIHMYATCRDCEWQESDQLKTTRLAREHAEKTGHRVDVERGQSWSYN